MNKKFLVVIAIAGLLILTACAKGKVSFLDDPPVSHADISQGPLQLSLATSSTYRDAQVMHIFVDGVLNDCVLQPEAISPCVLSIVNPGDHKIVARMDDGSQIETKFEWTPYSAADKMALGWAAVVGSEDTITGYGLMTATIVALFTMIFMVTSGLVIKTVYSLKVGGEIGALVGTILLIIYLFSIKSTGGAITIAVLLVLVLVLTLIVRFAQGIKYGRLDSTAVDGERKVFTGVSLDGTNDVPIAAISTGRYLVNHKSLDGEEQSLLPEG